MRAVILDNLISENSLIPDQPTLVIGPSPQGKSPKKKNLALAGTSVRFSGSGVFYHRLTSEFPHADPVEQHKHCLQKLVIFLDYQDTCV